MAGGRRYAWIAVAALLLLAGSVRADVAVPGETGSSLRRLSAVDKLIADAQWAEALDELQKILDDAGDDLVPLNRRWSVRARRLCHQRIAALPADVLRRYREKVDASARKWLEQGEANRDARALRKIIDEAFCSRPGDRALDLLGDLAFERGDFEGAERWWLFITPPAGVAKPERSPDALLFPDPQVDVAKVRAKQILARIFRGEQAGLAERLAAYRKEHAQAAGMLAGRKGVYADILKTLLEAPAAGREDWPTFAGTPTRSRTLELPPGRPNWRIPRTGPTWIHSLDGKDTDNEELLPTSVKLLAKQTRSLAFHPVIVGNQVFIADARYVRGFNLITGEPLARNSRNFVWFDLLTQEQLRGASLKLKLPAPADLNYTLTASGDRLYVRMGTQQIGAAVADVNTIGTFLVCLDRRTPGRVHWIEKANKGEKSTDMFEGAPIVHEGRVYIACVRFEGGGAITSIACHDAETGATRWRQPVDICEVHNLKESPTRYCHYLLTLAGTKIVFASHSGAVIALDADTGQRAWAVRYSSRGARTDEGQPSPRAVAPPLFAAGRVFVAPLDYTRVLCLDPDTGKLLWESEPPAETVHLLGVADDKLIMTTTNDIRGLEVDTGRTLRTWMTPADGGRLPSFGRGLLAAGWVYWPTVDGLRVLDQKTGEPVDPLEAPFNYQRNEIRGNLAAADGCLIVADAEKIYAFIPPRHLLEKRREQSKRDPESSAARLQLAVAQADAGLYDGDDGALANLAWIEKEAGNQDSSLLSSVRGIRYQTLLRQAEAASKQRHWDDAASALTAAAQASFPFSDRAQALLLRAALWQEAGLPARAVEAWQEVIALSTAQRARSRSEADRASRQAIAQIDRLIKQHGPAVYASFENQANQLLGKEKSDATALKIADEYPNSSAAGAALGWLARNAEEKDAGRAAEFFRHALDRARADKQQAMALAGLGRVYEQQQCWAAARDAWTRLARFGELSLLPDSKETPGAIARKQLTKAVYQRSADPLPVLSLPLATRWEIPLPPESRSRLLLPAGDDKDQTCFFLVDARGNLACLETSTGKARWRHALPFAPTWLGRYADVVIIAGSDAVQGLRLADGGTLWEHRGLKLAGFGLIGERLFFFENERRLVALDAGLGRRIWERWAPSARVRPVPPGGRFEANYLAGPQRLLVQTSSGSGLILASASGELLHRFDTASEPWPCAPLAVDEHSACVVPDSGRIALIDVDTAKEVWSHPLRKPGLSGVAPQIHTNGKAIWVLADGWVLEQLDALTGSALWTKGDPAWLSGPATAWSATSDDQAFYFTRDHAIQARSRQDGKSLWEAPLPEQVSGWHIVRTRDQLLVYPSPESLHARPPMVLGGYLVSVPSAIAIRHFPVLILNPTDGKLLQRLNFNVHAGSGALQIVGPDVVIMASGKGWGLSKQKK
jgi:outer membrane protein assembly factor BamB